MKQNNELNFNFGDSTVSSGRNQIEYTAQLNSISKQRATEALRIASTSPELFDKANNVFDGSDADELFSFLTAVVGNKMEDDIKFMETASENELSRLLESRRSDRSKQKAKGLKSSMNVALGYLAAGYAEMLVRKVWNKPYDSTNNQIVVDTEDLDAIKRKVKSLQSKKSRLGRLVQAGDATAQQEYQDVVDEIDRLNSFRPTTRTTVKTVIKDEADTTLIRNALQNVDMSKMNEDEQAKLKDLLAKLS